MNLPGYDAWKLACPYDMSAEEEARVIAERDDARERFRDAIEGALVCYRSDLYLSEVHGIVGEVLAKQNRQPGEPEHQVKMLNPIAAAPLLLDALQRVDHTLSVHGHIDADTPLHEFVSAAIAKATGPTP
jgi:hypothetical protein